MYILTYMNIIQWWLDIVQCSRLGGKPAQLDDGHKPVKMQSVAGQEGHPRRKNKLLQTTNNYERSQRNFGPQSRAALKWAGGAKNPTVGGKEK